MALNQWSRRSFTTVMSTIAMLFLLAGSSSSQDDGDDQPDVAREKPKAAAEADATTLTITITSAENGQASSMTVGKAKLFDGPLDGARLRLFDRRLKDVFAIEGKPYDRILFRVDKRLNSGDLIKIIHVCTRQKLADGEPLEMMIFASIEAD